MTESTTFQLTQEHLALLKRMCVRFDDECYDGAPAIDIKRPYGNSDVWRDVAEIIGIKRIEDDDGEEHWPKGTRDRCMALHREMADALQIVLSLQTFEPGTFVKNNPWEDWRRIA